MMHGPVNMKLLAVEILIVALNRQTDRQPGIET
jgi:hypothetical protein